MSADAFLKGAKVVKKILKKFSLFERVLWLFSVTLTAVVFVLFNGDSLSLAASLIGVTSLIFAAKGNPAGPALMIVFSVIYGVISYSFAYYGEMVTYLLMTMPMSVLSLVSWLKNPHNGNKSEVEVNSIQIIEIIFMLFLTIAVTAAFYFILGSLGTANLLPSTLSVATSFAAAYLTFRRSPFFAFAYALNDSVLIVMWVLAAKVDSAYVSVIVCFTVFLINDLYGFISWLKMAKRQKG